MQTRESVDRLVAGGCPDWLYDKARPGALRTPGGPQKGLIGNSRFNRKMYEFIYFLIFYVFSVKFRVLKLRFLVFSQGPGGFRELREAGRNRFHLSWYLLVPGVTSYDQKYKTN